METGISGRKIAVILLPLLVILFILTLTVPEGGPNSARDAGQISGRATPVDDLYVDVRGVQKTRLDPEKVKHGVAAPTAPIAAVPPAGGDLSPLSDEPRQKKFIRRVLSESWLGNKAVDGHPARQRVRIVEADFKYPYLRLEENVTNDPKTGAEVSEIVRSSVADHLLVGLKETVRLEKAREALRAAGYLVRSAEQNAFLLVELRRFSQAADQAEAVAALRSIDEFINYAEPDWIVHTSVTPNDPGYQSGNTWSFDNPGTVAGTKYDADIDAPDGWDQQHDAPAVIVAVTDTGIRYTHEDLAANMWEDGSGNHGFDAYDEDTDPMDINGHGTHVAGIIGAKGNNGVGTAGVAWTVQLMALRFIGQNGGTTSDAIRVMNYARLNGAHIINASWGGGGFSQGLLEAIQACHAADIPVVTAAGNYTRDNDTIPHYPSGYEPPNIVSVAASDASEKLSFFSNYGYSFVDLVAPGADIWSCGIASDSDYVHLSGTSMAAPHVSGALALAKARYPGQNSQDLVARLYNSVDVNPSYYRKVATGGRLNLYRLLADSSPAYLHDDFEKPYWFIGCYGYWCYSNARMTREADEDLFSPDTGQKSMWFRWTAPADGLVRFKGAGSTGDVSVVAFEGVDRRSLVRVADNFDQRPAKSSYLYFYATSGRTYTFSVDSRLPSPQILIAELVHRPKNDMFRDAVALGYNDRFEVLGNNCGATAEPWENASPHASVGNGRSVWWKWTPGFSGEFTLSTQSSSFDTVLAVYSGPIPAGLVEIASNDDKNAVDWTSEVTFNAVAGTTYYIAVDSYRGSSYGNIVLNGYVPGSLFILKHPETKLARLGDLVTFQVAAVGQGLRYQWEWNGQPIPGAVQPQYTILRTTSQDFGNYRVRVSDIASTIYSNQAVLSELQLSPQIVWQTRSRSIATGSSLDLRVRATGTGNLLYQWFKNDVEIQGETSDQLTLSNVSAAAAGNYTVTVNNEAGFTTSDPIVINVFDSPWDGWSYVDPSNQSGAIISIVKQGEKWVAAANAPNAVRISTSSDGKNWSHDFVKPVGTAYDLMGRHLSYGNGFWLCAADVSGFATRVLVFKSTDLVNWQQYLVPVVSPESLDSSSQLVFNDGYFYIGLYNAIYRSSDGVTWSLQQTPIGEKIRNGRIISDGSRLVVPRASTGKVYVLQSAGGSWQEVTVDATSSSQLNGVYWHNGLFYAYLSNVRYESANGLAWVRSLTTPSPDGWQSSTWNATKGTTVLSKVSSGFLVSLDGGFSWTNTYQNILPAGTNTAAADGSQFIFGTSTGGLIATDDPFAPTYPVPLASGSLVGVGYQAGQFIAQFASNTLVSSDGERWISHPSQIVNSPSAAPPPAAVPIAIGNEFWQVGSSSLILPAAAYYRGSIPGAVRPAYVDGLANGFLPAICEGPSGILSIQIPYLASYGFLARSVDQGATWSPVVVPGGQVSRHAKISYKGNRYFYQAYFGNTYASEDLINWIDLGTTSEIAFHGGEYWVFSGTASRRSSDLLNWSPTVYMQSPGIYAPVSFHGALVGMRNGFISYSYDAVNWVSVDLGFVVADFTTSGSILLAGGSQGQLAYTGNLALRSPSVTITEPAENATYLTDTLLAVKVQAFSPDQQGNPVVRLYYDGVFHAELASAPYEFELPVGSAGAHLIHVECQNGSGPISLARKRILVSSPPGLNHFVGLNGIHALPGTVVRRKDVLISSSSGAMITSLDGETWLPAALPSSAGLPQYTVEGEDRILVYTGETKAALSIDGVNWFGVVLPGTPAVKISYSHGHFWSMTALSVTMQGMLVSPDGINWTLRPHVRAPSALVEVVGDPNGVLLGRTSSSALWRSADGGRIWTAITAFSFVDSLQSNGTRFFIKEGSGTSRRAGSSVDGVNWVWSNPDSRYSRVKLVNGTAFAQDSAGSVFSLSYDGITWQSVPGGPLSDTLTWASSGHFYAKGPNPQGTGFALLRSHNGIRWDYLATWPTTEQVSLTANENGIFASTTGGGLWSFPFSTNTWTKLYSTKGSSPDFRDFENDGNVLIAIDAGKTLVRSVDDGRTWTTIYNPGTLESNQHNYTTILERNGVWLAWSPGTRLLRSNDGNTFTNITTSSGATTFKALGRNGSAFAAIRNDGAFMQSTDGLVWNMTGATGSFPDANVFKLVAEGGEWRALSFGPGSGFFPLKYSRSSDGTAWSQITMPGFHTAGNSVIASTSVGTIIGIGFSSFFTADGVTWTNTSANTSATTYMDAFYQMKDGWLERSDNGLTWTQIGFFGTTFSKCRVIDDTLYLYGSLYGNAAFAKWRLNDFAVTDVGAPTATRGVGATVNVSFTLTNKGLQPSPAGNFPARVLLSVDGFYGNSDDQDLGTAVVPVPELQPSQTIALQAQAIIPNRIRPGTYRTGIWFDPLGAREELNSSNNFAFSLPQHVVIPGWLLNTSMQGNGVIAQDAGQRLFAHGSRVSLTATSGKGARFIGWAGDALGAESQVTILMNQDKNVQAIFSSQVGLQVHIRGAGSVAGIGDQGLFEADDTASLEAIPGPGWVFGGWSGDASGNSASTTVFMDEPKSVVASFVLPIQGWKERHFTSLELLNPLLSGNGFDPDGDGLENWKEYLHASNPRDSLSRGVMRIENQGGFLSMIFTRLAGPDGNFGVKCRGSRNLLNWHAPDLEERILESANGVETVEVRIPNTGHPTGFLRFDYQQ